MDAVNEILKRLDAILNSPWDLGAQPRGHGHFNFAVILKADGLGTDKPVVECPDEATARHIIKVHNDALGKPSQALYEIYKDYDGNAPDTATLFTVSSEELAVQVVKHLNDLKKAKKDGALAHNEGNEWGAKWKYREPKPILLTSMAAVEAFLAERLEDEFGDDDEEEDDA